MKYDNLFSNKIGASGIEYLYVFLIVIGLAMVISSSLLSEDGLNMGNFTSNFEEGYNQKFCKAFDHNEIRYEWLESSGFDEDNDPICTVIE